MFARPVTRRDRRPVARFSGISGKLAREKPCATRSRTSSTAGRVDDRPRARWLIDVVRRVHQPVDGRVPSRVVGHGRLHHHSVSFALGRAHPDPGDDLPTNPASRGVGRPPGSVRDRQDPRPGWRRRPWTSATAFATSTSLSGGLPRPRRAARARSRTRRPTKAAGLEGRTPWPSSSPKTGSGPDGVGIYDTNPVQGTNTSSGGTHTRPNFVTSSTQVVLATQNRGHVPGRGQDRDETVTKKYPNVKVEDQASSSRPRHDQINRFSASSRRCLLLAIIIALFGIVNTLALSIIERTHELGLLRAVSSFTGVGTRPHRPMPFRPSRSHQRLVAAGIAFGQARRTPGLRASARRSASRSWRRGSARWERNGWSGSGWPRPGGGGVPRGRPGHQTPGRREGRRPKPRPRCRGETCGDTSIRAARPFSAGRRAPAPEPTDRRPSAAREPGLRTSSNCAAASAFRPRRVRTVP